MKLPGLGPFLKPGSLRNALLVRSLLVLAVLLLLIGIFQYIVMKDFMYRNKAEALEAQIMALPRSGFADWGWRFMRPGPAGAMTRDDRSIDGAPGHDTPERPANLEALLSPEIPLKQEIPRNGKDRAAIFLPPGTSLAVIDTELNLVDFADENGTSAPRLSREQYMDIRDGLKQRQHVPYKVVNNNEGEEQLVVFRHAFRGIAGTVGGGSQVIIQMGLETGSMKDVLVNQLLIFTILSLLALITGLLVYLPVLRRTLIPLSNVVHAVEKTDAGNLNERLPLQQGQTEIDRLAQSFNGMLNRLEQAFESEREAKEQMRRFVADASHELRTPLTSIHGFVEVLRRGADNHPEQRSAALRSMYGETKRLNALVDDLLTLAKLDQAPQLHLQPLRLDLLIQDMEPQLKLLAGARKIDFNLEEPAVIRCEAGRIKQALLNLFHNAVQHTDPENGEITISLSSSGSKIHLSVSDNGAGIEESHQANVFERFYRSDSSRTRKYGGSGLGLAITRSIVETHGGSICLTSQPMKGTTFEIHFPKSAL